MSIPTSHEPEPDHILNDEDCLLAEMNEIDIEFGITIGHAIQRHTDFLSGFDTPRRYYGQQNKGKEEVECSQARSSRDQSQAERSGHAQGSVRALEEEAPQEEEVSIADSLRHERDKRGWTEYEIRVAERYAVIGALKRPPIRR